MSLTFMMSEAGARFLGLARDSALVALLRAAAVVAMLAFVAVMSHWLAPGEFGILALLVSVTSLAAGFASFGQAEMIIRTVAGRRSGTGLRVASEVANEVVALVVWASASIGVALAGALAWSGYGLAVSLSAIPLTVGLSLMTGLAGAARIADNYAIALVPKEIAWRAMAVLAVVFLASLGVALGANEVAVLTGFAVLGCAVWQIAALGIRPASLFQPSPNALAREYRASSMIIAISTLALVMMNTLDVIVVGSRISAEAAAAYFPANRLALLTTFASLPIQLVVEQRIAVEAVSGERNALQRTSNLATLLNSGLCLVLGLAVIAGYPLYSWLFSTADAETFQILSIMVTGMVLGSLLGMPGSVLVMTGHQNAFARTTIVAAIVVAALLLAASASGDLLAIAGIATGIELLRKIALAILAYRRMGVLPFARIRL